MNLLLDTHVLIWALTEDARLSEKAREMILDPENTVYYSAVSVWEVSIKHTNHPENVQFTGRELAGFVKKRAFYLWKCEFVTCMRWKRWNGKKRHRLTTIPLTVC